jgi:hypothetical protein
MSGAEVRTILGTPLIYRDMKAHRSVSSDQAGVLPPSNDYDDVYEFTTPLNTYELQTHYALDGSESRLHAVPRLIAIYYELDKRISIKDLAKILDDLPEAATFCGAECTIAGRTEHSSVGDDFLYLHPKTVTPAERAEGEWIASIFGRFSSQDAPGRWYPTISVYYNQGSITHMTFAEDLSLSEGPVQTTWKPQGPTN